MRIWQAADSGGVWGRGTWVRVGNGRRIAFKKYYFLLLLKTFALLNHNKLVHVRSMVRGPNIRNIFNCFGSLKRR